MLDMYDDIFLKAKPISALARHSTHEVVRGIALVANVSAILATDVGCRLEILAAATRQTAYADTRALVGRCHNHLRLDVTAILAVDEDVAVDTAKTSEKDVTLECVGTMLYRAIRRG